MNAPSTKDQAILSAVFARMDVVAGMLSTGFLSGMTLVLATAILLLRATPEGSQIGPHLSLLTDYLPGYTVSWAGIAPAFAYGFGLGAVLGCLLGIFWNLAHYLALGILIIRSADFSD